MSVIPGGFAEVTIEFTIPGDEGPAAVVLGITNPTPNTAATICSDFETLLGTAGGLMDQMDDSWIASLITTRWTPVGSPTEIASLPVSEAGQLSVTALPPNNAVLLSKISGLAGRKNRGRMYLGGVSEAATDDGGFLTTGARSSWQAAIDAFDTALRAASYSPVILHTSPADTPTAVTDWVVQPKIATQRRRLR